jgi:hypothetical protein
MKIQHHRLKAETEYYQAVEKELKKFELRKNDRDFEIGDMLYLEETINGKYTGRQLAPKKIKYILHGGNYGLQEDYCIIGW